MDGERSRTGWAKSGDVNVAYQIVGDGPIDLVCADSGHNGEHRCVRDVRRDVRGLDRQRRATEELIARLVSGPAQLLRTQPRG